MLLLILIIIPIGTMINFDKENQGQKRSCSGQNFWKTKDNLCRRIVCITPKEPTLAVQVKSDGNQVQEDRGGLGVIEQGRKKGRSFGSSSAKVDFFQVS